MAATTDSPFNFLWGRPEYLLRPLSKFTYLFFLGSFQVFSLKCFNHPITWFANYIVSTVKHKWNYNSNYFKQSKVNVVFRNVIQSPSEITKLLLKIFSSFLAKLSLMLYSRCKRVFQTFTENMQQPDNFEFSILCARKTCLRKPEIRQLGSLKSGSWSLKSGNWSPIEECFFFPSSSSFFKTHLVHFNSSFKQYYFCFLLLFMKDFDTLFYYQFLNS